MDAYCIHKSRDDLFVKESNESGPDNGWDNRARLFVEKLQSVLELEEQDGEISPKSVMKIKALLKEFWKENQAKNME